jgi:hypothetical protein
MARIVHWLAGALGGLLLGAVFLGAAFLGAEFLAAEAWANGYATDDGGVLYRVIPDERRVERIGVVEVRTPSKTGTVSVSRPTLTDLALSDLHGLYGISFTKLYKLNIRDPSKATLVGPLCVGYGQFNALAFDDKGRLFALQSGTLYQVNLKTGKARVLGGLGGRWGSDGDLAWVGDALYATANGGGSRSSHLVRIDMQTWRAKDIGPIRELPRAVTPGGKGGSVSPGKAKPPKKAQPAGPRRTPRLRTFDDVWGLIWDGSDLYGVTSTGEVIEINVRTGGAQVVTRVRVSFYGACAMLRV